MQLATQRKAAETWEFIDAELERRQQAIAQANTAVQAAKAQPQSKKEWVARLWQSLVSPSLQLWGACFTIGVSRCWQVRTAGAALWLQLTASIQAVTLLQRMFPSVAACTNAQSRAGLSALASGVSP